MAADLRLRTHFFNLPDPRRAGRSPYRLLDLILIAIAATVAGAQDFGQIEVLARKRRGWLARFCRLPQGEEGRPLTPCHDTFERLFRRLNPRHFAGCLASWTAALAEGLGIKHVAIDGKALRGSGRAGDGLRALHLVSAWASEVSLSLGCVACCEKSNVSSSAYPLQKLNCWTLPSRSCLSWASDFGVSGNKYRPVSRCLLIWIVPLWMRSCSQCGGTSSRLAS